MRRYPDEPAVAGRSNHRRGPAAPRAGGAALPGQVLGRQVTEFKDTVPAYRTRVYFVGDGQAWARERQRADGVMAAFQEANQAK